jgi:Zn-dependent protease with chaperone function
MENNIKDLLNSLLMVEPFAGKFVTKFGTYPFFISILDLGRNASIGYSKIKDVSRITISSYWLDGSTTEEFIIFLLGHEAAHHLEGDIKSNLNLGFIWFAMSVMLACVHPYLAFLAILSGIVQSLWCWKKELLADLTGARGLVNLGRSLDPVLDYFNKPDLSDFSLIKFLTGFSTHPPDQIRFKTISKIQV